MSKKESIGVEIERKYIINLPNFSLLQSQSSYTHSKITQIYLPSENGETHRVRRRIYTDKTICTETKKIRIDSMSSTEIEREISLDEFHRIATNAKQGTRPVEKERHTFIYEGQLFEIDVYGKWKSTALMETELKDREQRVNIPPFIKVIREVTGNKSYSNASMAREFPKED